ncbi:DUF805 domain-containing protein [Pseudotamlana agarivorans]|uniref:DUF805 domain-containing protein n=1 Tax=Pseudotamlana agarivorans TaxID=481183 RepID=UPI00082AFF8E|nr:DUF805 domain-containing protein [Tamlana agarivorans]
MNYIINPLVKVFDFNGKATLKEFWLFFLFYLISGFIAVILSAEFHIEALKTTYRYLILIPLTSLGFRRLNDAGFNKWLFLVPFVNLILAGINRNN